MIGSLGHHVHPLDHVRRRRWTGARRPDAPR